MLNDNFKTYIMNIINDGGDLKLSKTSSEYVQQEKVNKVLATYMLRKGLRLYAYNRAKGMVKEVKIHYGDMAYVISDGRGGLTWHDPERMKCEVDSDDIHFEALNEKTAENRVKKYIDGKISNLCNLRKPDTTNKFKNLFQS